MRWHKSGKLNIGTADLALLTSPAFKDKFRSDVDSWMAYDGRYPPIPSAVFFVLLSSPEGKKPETLWMRYRQLLEVSNNPGEFYRLHTIFVNGKTRTVAEPLKPLADYQKWILKHILENAPVTDCAFAYRKGLSLVDNARAHKGHKVLVKLDISHFFDSITFGMVYGIFYGQMHYPREGATLLTSLCCLGGRLPQGACTSPYLSNLCFVSADKEFIEYCKRNGLSYSRYSDDLTFSGDEVDVKALISFAGQILKKYGFKMNYKKIHVDGKGRQHKVTGIVCNDKLNTPADYRRQVRQEMFYLKKYGVEDHLKHLGNSLYASDSGGMDVDVYYSSLLGRIAYILQVTPGQKEFAEYRDYVKACMRREDKLKTFLRETGMKRW